MQHRTDFRKIGRFKTIKIPYSTFEEYYMAHPGKPVKDMAKVFDVSPRTIYYKLKAFNRKNNDNFDKELLMLIKNTYKEGYSEGYESGFLVGGSILGLSADLLKSNNIGISDLIKWISENIKGKV
jgi:hypothetical protein